MYTPPYLDSLRCLIQCLPQNMAALSSDLWPTMKSTLTAPWRVLLRQSLVDSASQSAPQRSFKSTPSQRVEDTVSLSACFPHAYLYSFHKDSSSTRLPDCLASVPMSTLRSMHHAPGLSTGKALSITTIRTSRQVDSHHYTDCSSDFEAPPDREPIFPFKAINEGNYSPLFYNCSFSPCAQQRQITISSTYSITAKDTLWRSLLPEPSCSYGANSQQ